MPFIRIIVQAGRRQYPVGGKILCAALSMARRAKHDVFPDRPGLCHECGDDAGPHLFFIPWPCLSY